MYLSFSGCTSQEPHQLMPQVESIKITQGYRKKCLRSLYVGALLVSTIGVSGCASMSGMVTSQLEPPSVEKQLNRISTGVNIVRTNYDIMYNMTVSADAEWVDIIASGPSDDDRKEIEKSLSNDPFYATVEYTDMLAGQGVAMKMLSDAASGGSHISPLDINLFHRLDTLYTERPDIYAMPESIDEYKEFKRVKLKRVEALSSNPYKNVEHAVIALTPSSMQNDLTTAKAEWDTKIEAVLSLKQETGELESFIEDDKNENSTEIATKKEQLEVKETELKEAEELADAQEESYFKLLDNAVVAIESEFNSDSVPLALKLEKLLNIIDTGSLEAGTLFTIALTKMTVGGVIGNLKNELAILEQAKHQTCCRTGKNNGFIDQRVKRLGVNALNSLPNLFVGAYFAVKQSALAGKYQDVVKAVLDAHKAQLDSNKAKT